MRKHAYLPQTRDGGGLGENKNKLRMDKREG